MSGRRPWGLERHPLAGQINCTHRAYQMTCADFDLLLERANGRCEICGVPAAGTHQRKLMIDHDHRRGDWAVRGLLCHACNSGIGRDLVVGPIVDRYLATPWVDWAYPDRMNWIPEPPEGAMIRTWNRRTWRRAQGFWHPFEYYHDGSLRWGGLTAKYGPHRMELCAEPPRCRYRPPRPIFGR